MWTYVKEKQLGITSVLEKKNKRFWASFFAKVLLPKVIGNDILRDWGKCIVMTRRNNLLIKRPGGKL
jgi:hypothetical protein